jgi:hypothetical protein
MDSHHSVIGEGARIVWRRQGALWWVYVVNLLLGLMGTLPTALGLGAILNRSLASEKLVHGFDLATAAELAMHPSQPFHATSATLFTLVFFIFMLFVEGGVLAAYRADRKLTKAEFFEACGRFFWRFFRLLIVFVIALVPVFILNRVVTSWSDRLATDSPEPLRGFHVQVAGTLIVVFLLMALRLAFDMAQVRVVVEDERAVRKALWGALKLTVKRFPSLFGMYFVVSLLAWAGLAATFWVWAHWIHPEWIGMTFLLTQVFLLVWLGTRFWQRASEMTWYLRHAAAPPVVTSV